MQRHALTLRCCVRCQTNESTLQLLFSSVGHLVWFHHNLTLVYYTVIVQTVEFKLSQVAYMAFFQDVFYRMHCQSITQDRMVECHSTNPNSSNNCQSRQHTMSLNAEFLCKKGCTSCWSSSLIGLLDFTHTKGSENHEWATVWFPAIYKQLYLKATNETQTHLFQRYYTKAILHADKHYCPGLGLSHDCQMLA